MSKKLAFVGKKIQIAGHTVQFDSKGNLRYPGGEVSPEHCSLICTKKQVAVIVATAQAFELAVKLEAKINLSGHFELENTSDNEYGLRVGCTFVPYDEIVRAFGRRRK